MQYKDKTRYLFHSRGWLDLIRNNLQFRELTKGYRQSDSQFISLLDDLRFGVHSEEMWQFLDTLRNRHKTWDQSSNSIKPTLLSGYRNSADRYNAAKLFELPGRSFKYDSIDLVKLDEKCSSWSDTTSPLVVNPIFKSFSSSAEVNFKVGAQVVLLRNIDVKNALANGSRGVIIGFERQYDNLLEKNVVLPVVRFLNGQSFAIGYHDFETKLDIDRVTIVRKQIPLRLGWGMTIHRAQGMTLDRVIIDLETAFAPGHAYVAMSRVKSVDGLSLKKFSKNSLVVSSRVQEFYNVFMPRSNSLKSVK